MNHSSRMKRLMSELEQPLLVTSLVNIRYLTGFTGSSAFLYVTPADTAFLTDGRYAEVAEGLVAGLPATRLSVYREGLYDRLAELFAAAATVQLEADHITWDAKRSLAQRFGGNLVAAANTVEDHRNVKDPDEVAALRRAAAVGDHAFSRLGDLASQAATEGELAELLVAAMAAQGGERAGWPPIVALGPHAARPHHRSGDGRMEDGLLLLDFGCLSDGYHSDMTRTVWRGNDVDAKTEDVFQAVLEANLAGIEAVKPGVSAGDVDRTCRDALAARGYEEYFLHSTGHGVGLEIHEAPSVRKGSEDILEPGQVITVEPGAYLPAVLGVRIEDMVLVTEAGSDVLTGSTKELRSV